MMWQDVTYSKQFNVSVYTWFGWLLKLYHQVFAISFITTFTGLNIHHWFTFSDQLFHRDLVSTDGKHPSNIVAAASTRSRPTPETSALRLWHTSKLLHSCLCVPVFPKWTIETDPNSRRRLKPQYVHHRSFSPACWEISSPEMRLALQCQKDAERRSRTLPISPEAQWNNCIEVNRQTRVLVVNKWQQKDLHSPRHSIVRPTPVSAG